MDRPVRQRRGAWRVRPLAPAAPQPPRDGYRIGRAAARPATAPPALGAEETAGGRTSARAGCGLAGAIDGRRAVAAARLDPAPPQVGPRAAPHEPPADARDA